ncbi:MAG: hypothetical protein ACRD2A_22200 [Vicinamibacterales bacterium]
MKRAFFYAPSPGEQLQLVDQRKAIGLNCIAKRRYGQQHGSDAPINP